MSGRWAPDFGARLDESGVRVRVCAPGATTVRIHLDEAPAVAMARVDSQTCSRPVWPAHAPVTATDCNATTTRRGRTRAAAGSPTAYTDRRMLIDPAAFAWTDAGWRGVARHRPRHLRAARRHVHARRAPSRAAAAASTDLADLGVTAIELMPVADFPGTRNWGYDGVRPVRARHGTARPTTCARWSTRARARAGGAARRGLQPPRTGRQLPGRLQPTTSPTGTRPLGRGDQPRRAGQRARCASSSSRTPCTG